MHKDPRFADAMVYQSHVYYEDTNKEPVCQSLQTVP